ncbi:hypothetical protein E4U54_002165, partial [Claviceps lovelessii]
HPRWVSIAKMRNALQYINQYNQDYNLPPPASPFLSRGNASFRVGTSGKAVWALAYLAWYSHCLILVWLCRQCRALLRCRD